MSIVPFVLPITIKFLQFPFVPQEMPYKTHCFHTSETFFFLLYTLLRDVGASTAVKMYCMQKFIRQIIYELRLQTCSELNINCRKFSHIHTFNGVTLFQLDESKQRNGSKRTQSIWLYAEIVTLQPAILIQIQIFLPNVHLYVLFFIFRHKDSRAKRSVIGLLRANENIMQKLAIHTVRFNGVEMLKKKQFDFFFKSSKLTSSYFFRGQLCSRGTPYLQ